MRILTTDSLGRFTLFKNNVKKPSGFIILLYPCRALEWIHLRKLYAACLAQFGFGHLNDDLDDVLFAWRYHKNLASRFYRPAYVFKKFTFLELLDANQRCVCGSSNRLALFLDPRTLDEKSSHVQASVHVRSVNLNIIHHDRLRQALAMGLNHIPLKSTTSFAACIATILDGFSQLEQIFRLGQQGFPLDSAMAWIRNTCLDQLKACSRTNQFGFRHSEKDLMQDDVANNEIEWLLQHLYCSGLDKAANNAIFICIKHMRFMALERLSGPDFLPCMENSKWVLPSEILSLTVQEITALVPELLVSYQALPYLMSTYKMHKNKYRWLTNAFQTVYTNIAHLITITTMEVLESVKEWALQKKIAYARFLNVETSLYWIVNSSIEVALNLPHEINDIFVGDIARCYESIPLTGPDNLLDAIAFMVKLGFKQAKSHHPRASPLIWVRVNSDGQAAHAQWATSRPSYGECFAISADCLIEIHGWLMKSCYVGLGDRVWKQILGIPMGFSCSPLWCNTYLLYYEVTFIMRLARLGKSNLLGKFKSAFRYIDDLCWLNAGNPSDFLNPLEPRTESNPMWVYPLDVLDIKPEVAEFSKNDPSRGITAHFMNLEIALSDDHPGVYETCKFDKRRALPFEYSQYIMFKANRPIKQSYNIAVSQTVPILYLSSTVTAAAREINILIGCMIRNGFLETRLRMIITRFLESNPFPGLKFDLELLIPKIRYSYLLNNLLTEKERQKVFSLVCSSGWRAHQCLLLEALLHQGWLGGSFSFFIFFLFLA